MFENTDADFAQLQDALEALITGNGDSDLPLSERECNAAASLIERVLDIASLVKENWGIDADDDFGIALKLRDAVRSANATVKELKAEGEREDDSAFEGEL